LTKLLILAAGIYNLGFHRSWQGVTAVPGLLEGAGLSRVPDRRPEHAFRGPALDGLCPGHSSTVTYSETPPTTSPTGTSNQREPALDGRRLPRRRSTPEVLPFQRIRREPPPPCSASIKGLTRGSCCRRVQTWRGSAPSTPRLFRASTQEKEAESSNGFAVLPNGVPIDRELRALWRQSLIHAELNGLCPSPRTPSRPPEQRSSSPGSTRRRRRTARRTSPYQSALHARRGDLQAAFPDPEGGLRRLFQLGSK